MTITRGQSMDAHPLPRDCTFPESDWRILADYWHPVAFGHDVGSKPAHARLLDVDLVVYRTSQGVTVARNICLHRGSELTQGRLDGDELVCAYHGWRYGPDGQCTRIPAQPASRRISPSIRLLTYPVQERYGLVWTCLSGRPSRGLPDFPEAEDAGYRWLNLPPLDWNTSAARQIDNFLDVSHFPFVHQGTFGNAAETEVPEIPVQVTEYGLTYDYNFNAANPEHSPMGGSDTLVWETTYEVTLPFAVRLWERIPARSDDAYHVVFNVASPVSSRKVRAFFFVCRNFDFDVPAHEIMDWEGKVMNEDKAIVEGQRPEELPLDLAAELHVQSDRMTIAYRRRLAALGLSADYSA
jgi:phenylpropionate dioxygenase-like ring-hydroxylating dioxygenase large terminal subunit